jgi:hypothetical protein
MNIISFLSEVPAITSENGVWKFLRFCLRADQIFAYSLHALEEVTDAA